MIERRFAGVIKKDTMKITEYLTDTYVDLQEEWESGDTWYDNCIKNVLAELKPVNNEWWVNPAEHPEKWELSVDGDLIPDWFLANEQKYESKFRSLVYDWWKDHVFVAEKIDTLENGYFLLKDCKVDTLDTDVKAVLNDSMVEYMHSNAVVLEMLGYSTIENMFDFSEVQWMKDSSVVGCMWGYSSIVSMYDKTTVHKMYDFSIVHTMHGSSSVENICDYALARDFKYNLSSRLLTHTVTYYF